MKVNRVILGLENLEQIALQADMIGVLDINDVKRTINRVSSDAIDRYFVTDRVSIEILPNGDHEINGPVEDSTEETKPETVFNRLRQWNDIVLISLLYEDGSTEDIYPPYLNENDSNVYQSSYLSDGGHLYISINKDRESAEDLVKKQPWLLEEEDVRYDMISHKEPQEE